MNLTARLALAKFNRQHYDDADPDDNLRPARGIVYGLIAGLVFWTVVFTVLFA
jgi:hypothetical protein